MPKSNSTEPRSAQRRPASGCRQRRQHNVSLGHSGGDGIPATRLDMDLLGTIISDFVVQVLSFVTQSDRENARKRQAKGIAAAKAKGIRFGRRPSPLPKDFPKTYKRWSEGLISTSEAAKHCGMSRSTFRYRASVFEKHQKNGDGNDCETADEIRQP